MGQASGRKRVNNNNNKAAARLGTVAGSWLFRLGNLVAGRPFHPMSTPWRAVRHLVATGTVSLKQRSGPASVNHGHGQVCRREQDEPPSWR